MNILILGSSGMLGNHISRTLSKDHHLLKPIKKSLNITNEEILLNYFEANTIDLVINCSAYTNVPLAEEKTDEAFSVNAEGPKNLAKISKKFQVPLIHFSTDYVFDGKKESYIEEDKMYPLNVYGESKKLGEHFIRENLDMHLIFRISWIYCKNNESFITKILDRLGEKKDLEVVSDQIGSPTWCGSIASAIQKILYEIDLKNFQSWGTYHLSNSGNTSWFNFANEIALVWKKKTEIKSIYSSQLPLNIKRPKRSVLKNDKFKDTFGFSLDHWKVALRECKAS